MDPFAYKQNLPNFKSSYDPSLTLEINGTKEVGPVFHNSDKDPTLFAIFDAPEHTLNTLNIFDQNELPLSLQEPEVKRGDFNNSYCAVTGSNNKFDEKETLLTDFDNSSSSPNSQSSKNRPICNNGVDNGSEYECTSLDNLIFEDMIGNSTTLKSTPVPIAASPTIGEIMLECHTDIIDRPLSRVSNSSFPIKSPTTQNRSPKKYSMRNKPSKIQKPKHYQNFNDLQNLISSYNMELNYILLSEDPDNRKNSGVLGNRSCKNNNNKNSITSNSNDGIIQEVDSTSTNSNEIITTEAVLDKKTPIQNFPLLKEDDQSIMESIPTQAIESAMTSNNKLEVEIQNSNLNNSYESTGTTTTSTTTDDSLEYKPSKLNNSKVPRSRRTRCLKKDSTVSMNDKLEYFKRVVENARDKKLRGIFLRDHAASELAISKNDYKTMELNLINIDSISQTLGIIMQGQKESFRTVWKIFRQQYDHEVYLTFQLSDEYAAVNENETEISIFTLMVPGHIPKHLITGCQYLQLVNFILGKEYNHLINDNLAETTVGSDGKMISTQKHHASRVRSHVKKYLKRHVVKDLRRYTNEERSNVSEFHYQMVLHNLVMGCILKKPFESKVSVALMELPKVKDALIKQTDFFVFKRI